jgi:hypothetical protein
VVVAGRVVVVTGGAVVTVVAFVVVVVAAAFAAVVVVAGFAVVAVVGFVDGDTVEGVARVVAVLPGAAATGALETVVGQGSVGVVEPASAATFVSSFSGIIAPPTTMTATEPASTALAILRLAMLAQPTLPLTRPHSATPKAANPTTLLNNPSASTSTYLHRITANC